MALPKIASPTYELTIPSTKEEIKYRPFLVKEEKLLLLANETGDEKDMINAVKQIIQNCCFESVNVEDLALFDIEYLFLRIRSKSVGEVINLKLLCEDDGETYADVSINLDDVEVQYDKKHTNQIKLTDDITLVMKYPQYEMFAMDDDNQTEAVFAMMAGCIDKIVEGETIHERADFTTKELDEFMESLTSGHFALIQDFFQTMPRVKHEVKFKNPNTKKQNKITLEGMQSFFE
tara:strand:+ start:1616 stop:2317 length:702 start_codon:yes stop_codon:yes gene_type:complete